MSTRRALWSAALCCLAACGAPEAGPGLGGATAQSAASGVAAPLPGTWALRLAMPVAWPAGLGIRAGEGEVVHLLRQVQPDAAAAGPVLTVCAVALPDYHGLLGGEIYGIRIPAAALDAAQLAPAGGAAVAAAGGAAGTGVTLTPLAIELGVEMPAPLADRWPQRPADLAGEVDADHDGAPGVTAVADASPGYVPPPTNALRSAGRRAVAFHLALRHAFSGAGTFLSDARAEGVLEAPDIGGELALSSIVLGCVKASGAVCGPGDVALMNRGRPRYRRAGPGSLTMVRLDAGATCAEVRALSLP